MPELMCAVCIELSMDAPAEHVIRYARTIIDGTCFCTEHAELKIKARHQQALQQREEMNRLLQGIENMKVGE